MSKRLLSLGLLMGCTLGMQAQTEVFHESFDAAQTKTEAEAAWYEFINNEEGDTRQINSEQSFLGSGCMEFINTDVANDDAFWRRAIKFRNLPLQEGKSYRLTYRLKGTNTYNLDGTEDKRCKMRVGLMQGGENADIALMDAKGNEFYYEVSYFNPANYEPYTRMFYFADAALQKSKYAENHPDAAPLADTFFATFNIFNPGQFYLDEVRLVESSIAGIKYCANYLAVDFGYTTNIATLAGAQPNGIAVLPNECVTVKNGDDVVPLLSVELRKDGKLYIFPDDDQISLSDGDKITVDFTNPADESMQVKYTGDRCPEGAAMNFTAEAAEFDEYMDDQFSIVYALPTLVSTNPEDGSFDLPLDIKNFEFTFNKNVNTDKATAELFDEYENRLPLSVKNDGFTSVMTVLREGANLKTGKYTLHVANIVPERDSHEAEQAEFNISFNVGKKEYDPNDVAYVAVRDSFDIAGGDGYTPKHWQIYAGGLTEDKVLAAGTAMGSGPRIFKFAEGGDFIWGCYIRGGGWMGDGQFKMGERPNEAETDNNNIYLQAGKHKLRFSHATWAGTETTFDYSVYKLGDPSTVLLTGKSTSTCNVNGRKTPINPTKVEQQFLVEEEGDYVIAFTGLSGEIVVANIELQYIPDNPGAEYKTALANALEGASKQLAQMSDNPRYEGIDLENLYNTISKYEEANMTSPSQYKAAVSELNAATKTALDHMTLINTYTPLAKAAYDAINKYASNKVATTQYYTTLKAVYEKYLKEVIPGYVDDLGVAHPETIVEKPLVDNTELQTAIDELTKSTKLLSNVADNGIPALTARINLALKALDDMQATLSPEQQAVVDKAKQATTDDEALLAQLKTIVKDVFYTKAADPNNTLFVERTVKDADEVEQVVYNGTIDFSFYLKNPNLYITTKDRLDMSPEACPGWTITIGEGYEAAWTTGWSWVMDDTQPAYDAMMGNWGKDFSMEQTITDLPAGVYVLKCGFGERNEPEETPYDSYFYYTAGEEGINTDRLAAPFVGQSFPTNNIVTEEPIEILDGKLIIGAHASNNAHVFLNNFNITLAGQSYAFDYATGVDEVAAHKEVKSVECYDLNGRRIAHATKGVNIIKRIHSDGSVSVSKLLIK